MPGNDFNQFMNNFRQFILIEHHFILGITYATPAFIGIFWLAFSLAFIMIATRFEKSFVQKCLLDYYQKILIGK